jgi:ribosomal protein S27AE
LSESNRIINIDKLSYQAHPLTNIENKRGVDELTKRRDSETESKNRVRENFRPPECPKCKASVRVAYRGDYRAEACTRCDYVKVEMSKMPKAQDSPGMGDTRPDASLSQLSRTGLNQVSIHVSPPNAAYYHGPTEAI